jgi:hypothetical protein
VRNRKRNTANTIVSLVSAALVLAAVVQELRRPPGQRSWHGTVAGFVPYDFRPPTIARVQQRLWAPENAQILMPHLFGVGWTINAGRIVTLVRGFARRTGSETS